MLKSLLFLGILFLGTASHAQDTKLLASCCEKPSHAESFGRCSGDASCTACKNCSACKHCSKEGGSCGVCASYAAPVKVPALKANSVKKSNVSKASTQPVYKRLQMLETTSQVVNVRIGPGTNYDIVETIKKGSMLTYISHEGEWLYVRINDSGDSGWVHQTNVK